MSILCQLDDIPDGDARGFRHEGRALVAVRLGDQVQVFVNRCPHIGIPLNFSPDVFLDVSGDYLQCANHGALFRKDDGLCLRGPCVGRALEAVPCRQEEGQVVLG